MHTPCQNIRSFHPSEVQLPYLIMFSRVAHLARGPLRRVASRGFSARSAAALPGSRKVSLLAGSAAVVAAGLAVATTQQQQAPAHCHHEKFPYTGVPGTSFERTFIVSYSDALSAACTTAWSSNLDKYVRNACIFGQTFTLRNHEAVQMDY